MGIAGFQRWFLETFPSTATVITEETIPEKFDHVLFDLNQLIHLAARVARNRDQFFIRLYKWLDKVLRLCVPRETVLIAFDGPAPLAKLVTQKRRRVMEARKLSRTQKPKKRCGVDVLSLSPGTELMQLTLQAIEFYVCSRLQSKRSSYRNVRFVVSGPTVPGEGEIKIIDYIHRCVEPNHSVIVIGSDADLVLLGLATQKVRDFFVFVINPRPKAENSAESGTEKHHQSVNATTISVWQWIRLLDRLFPGETASVRLDLAVLLMMQGNDYVPKLRGSSFKSIWGAYKALKQRQGAMYGRSLLCGRDRTINLEFLYALMNRIADPLVPQLTRELIEMYRDASLRGQEIARLADAEAARAPTDEVQSHDSTADVEQISYPGNPEDETLEDSMAGEAEMHGSSHDDLLENVEVPEGAPAECDEPLFDTESWLRMLLWAVAMYVDGFCPDFYFTYPRPYGPSAADILRWLKEIDGDPIPMLQPPISVAPPLPPHAALLALVPARAARLLPRPLYKRVLMRTREAVQNDAMADISRATPDETAKLITFILQDDGRRTNRALLLRVIEKIPEDEYEDLERTRIRLGSSLAFELTCRHSISRNEHRFAKLAVPYEKLPKPPVERFARLAPSWTDFVIQTVPFTTAPPCHSWNWDSNGIPTNHLENRSESVQCLPFKRAFTSQNRKSHSRNGKMRLNRSNTSEA
jgi:hypothetical protein